MVMGGDICSVTKQVGGTAAIFVCVCVFVRVCVCLHVYGCKCMFGTEACPN